MNLLSILNRLTIFNQMAKTIHPIQGNFYLNDKYYGQREDLNQAAS